MKKAIPLILFFAICCVNSNCQVNDSARRKSDEIISYIKSREYKKIKECFLPKVIASISDSTLKQSVDLGADFIEQYGIPKYEEVRIVTMPTSSFDKSIIDKNRILLKFFEYPFPATGPNSQEQKIISIGFIEEITKDQIISIQVIDHSVR